MSAWGIRCIYGYYVDDKDQDGVLDPADNCRVLVNSNQANTDGEVLDLSPLFVFDDITNITADVGKPVDRGDACDPDGDGDGRSSSDETNIVGCPSATGKTDPLNDDSDSDLVLDGVECFLGTNPNSSASKPATSPDSDHDGLADGYEALFGTNPAAFDTVGDAVVDGSEAMRYRSNALNSNSDGTNCLDRQEVASFNLDLVVNSGDQGTIDYAVAHFSLYPYTDHHKRDFDVDRDGVINSGDQGRVQATVAVAPVCPP
jgi:hypothetical protein